MFLVCVFSDMGYPDVIWGHHVGIDTVNWNRYCEVDTAHIHFGVVIFDDPDGDVEMGLSMCGRFGDWVILGMGYPGDGLSWGWVILGTGLYWGWVILGWYNQSDWEDWIVRRVEEVGDGDNLGHTCNLLEHE